MRTADALAAAWEELRPNLECRYRNAETYAQVLSGGPWHLLDGWRTSGVCWRFSLLVDFPDCVVPFCESVRGDGFHVSNLYWPLHQFFNPEDDCPASVDFARRVVNLWVESGIGHDYAQRCGESLWKNVERMGLKDLPLRKE
jgi:hypothetical protein